MALGDLRWQKDVVRNVSKTMAAVGKQALLGLEKNNMFKKSEMFSIYADICAELYLEAVSNMALLYAGHDQKCKTLIKDNHKNYGRKIMARYQVKQETRDKTLGSSKR